MQIETSRFGKVDVNPDDILLFTHGVAGFEDYRHWVLLGDPENAAVGWLQSATDGDLAFPVVSPRRFVDDYLVRVNRHLLTPLQVSDTDQVFVLTMIAKGEAGITANLRAPVLVNLDRRLAAQVITSDDQPLAFVIEEEAENAETTVINPARANLGAEIRKSA